MLKNFNLSIFESVITIPIKLESFLQLSELPNKYFIRIIVSIPDILKRAEEPYVSLTANTEQCKRRYKTLQKPPQSHTTGEEISY